MADIKTKSFVTASKSSIKDPQLRQALEKVGTGFDGARREAIEEISEEKCEEWRLKAREIKEHAIDNLD